MVERIFGSGGTLDKFMGDGIMAYFNAPLDQPDHAERAVRCASSMMDGLAELNGKRVARGEAILRMGIGIHTGPATLGSIGPDVRQEYTAIGETVNLAAHLEQLTRETGGGITGPRARGVVSATAWPSSPGASCSSASPNRRSPSIGSSGFPAR